MNTVLKFSRSSAGVRGMASLVKQVLNEKTGIVTVTMDRPPVSSVNLELANDLLSTINDLESSRCRGMILTSSSPTVFSAGLDLKDMYQPNEEKIAKFWTVLQDMWIALYGSSFPTVAAINGHSPAGGCLLACSCEYRVMVQNPQKPYNIGLNETLLGIVAPAWFIATYRNILPRRVAEMALTSGTLFTDVEAKANGLVDELATDKDDAIAKAEKWLSRFSRVSPIARAHTKRLLRGDDIQALKDNKKQDLDTFLKAITSPAVQKGLGMYLESLKKKAA